MATPVSRWGIKKVCLLLLTVVVFVVMVKLGFWQLDRGNQKLALEQELQLRSNAAPVAIEDWLLGDTSQATGTKVSLTIEPLPSNFNVQRVYWDNQTWQGKVGYLAFQPVRLLATDPRSDFEVFGLIELGFIPASGDRQVLPEVAGIVQPQPIVGRLYRKQDNPMSQGLMSEVMEIKDGRGLRIQNLSLESLPQHLFPHTDRELFSYVVQPMQPLLLTRKNEELISATGLNIMVFLWGLGMGTSRMLLGMHWPQDVLASTCLAAIISVLSVVVIEKVWGRFKQSSYVVK